MPDEDGLVRELIQQDCLDVAYGRPDTNEIFLSDATEARVVIEDGVVRFHQSLVDGAPIGADDGDARQFGSFGGVAHFAVEREDAVVAVHRRPFRQRRHETLHRFGAERVADVPLTDAATVRSAVALAARVALLAASLERPPPVVQALRIPARPIVNQTASAKQLDFLRCPKRRPSS